MRAGRMLCNNEFIFAQKEVWPLSSADNMIFSGGWPHKKD